MKIVRTSTSTQEDGELQSRVVTHPKGSDPMVRREASVAGNPSSSALASKGHPPLADGSEEGPQREPVTANTEGQPGQDEASLASFRIECRAEDVELDLANLTCTLKREFLCGLPAEWWVDDEPTCSICVPARLNDEGPTVIVPITGQPTPTINDCIAHRCSKHLAVPVQNTNEESGAECGGCIRETADTLYAAVKYALDRQQTDADFGYVAGFGTETFRLLCIAEAAHLGKPFEDVEKARGEQHWRYTPRVIELQERIEELEARS